jgi:uncharacterized membrane protein YgdD (TMEM256/DUF423 family)
MSAARLFLAIGATYGFLGVALGAFGAHALRARLAPDLLAVYHTGVEYQFYHAFALLVVGLLMSVRPAAALKIAGWCFAGGVLLFSGSLYVFVVSGVRGLGVVTPVGGLLFMVGWGALLVSVFRGER